MAQPFEMPDIVESPSGGQFLKRVEYNLLLHVEYNLKSKNDLEKLFFGDFNARLEFFVEPSFHGAYGFRIVEDSLPASYRIEVKYVCNFDEVNAQLSEEYPTIRFSVEDDCDASPEKKEQVIQHNLAMYEKQWKERPKRYEVSTQSIPITSRLADTLYATVVAAIDNFKGIGITSTPVDGSLVTFRCVVEDEVWTFTIHEPRGYMRNLTDICNRIVKDVEANQRQLNEDEYIALLGDLGV